MAFCSNTVYASHHPRSSNASRHSRSNNTSRRSRSNNSNVSKVKTVAEKTLFVGPRQVDCQGEALQKCYLVKESADESWTYLYEQIAGFTWEAGNQYELRVKAITIENPPADASSIKYELIKVVNKKLLVN